MNLRKGAFFVVLGGQMPSAREASRFLQYRSKAGLQPEFRKWGCGALLLTSAWNSFKKTKWIRGISARYTISNSLSRKLHENTGFKILKTYFDEDLKEERAYAVFDF